MPVKLFDSERKVMEPLWRSGDLPAGQIAKLLLEEIGWNRNTTYTVIKKCIEKGAIERREPGFVCHALIGREEVQRQETDELIDKMFGGSQDAFFAAMLRPGRLSREEIDHLKKLVDELE